MKPTDRANERLEAAKAQAVEMWDEENFGPRSGAAWTAFEKGAVIAQLTIDLTRAYREIDNLKRAAARYASTETA